MRRTLAALCIFATPAFAQEPPNVVVDIAPIRSLVAQIMEGVGTPSQIIPAGASPHGYAMRPSEARALSNADLVVWVGPALTHWLEEPLETLAPEAERIALMVLGGSKELQMREAEKVEAAQDDDHADHDHDRDKEHKDEAHDDHSGHDHDKEGHEDHADHAHDKEHEEEGHDDHADHDDHAGHGHGHAHHGTVDPHGWLAPSNVALWAGVISKKLGEIDPVNAQTYTANWENLNAEIQTLEADLTAMLTPYRDTPFVVLHDAFHYFEETFGVEAESFVIAGDGATPGPARVQALRAHLAENPVTCAFTAPQENERLLRTATEGQDIRVAVLDPLGDGAASYATFMRAFATAMVDCFEGR